MPRKELKNENMEIGKQESQVGKKKDKREENQPTLGNALFPRKPSPIVPPLPFLQRFKKANLDGQFTKFLNMFKKLKGNISFAKE